MGKHLTRLMLAAAIMLAGASTFVSCKDTNSDELADLRGQNADLRTVIEKKTSELAAADATLKQAQAQLEQQVADINKYLGGALPSNLKSDVLSYVKEYLANNKLDGYATTDDLAAALQRIADLEAKIGQACTCAQLLQSLQDQINTIVANYLTKDEAEQIYAKKADFESLQNAIAALKQDIVDNEIAPVREKAETALALAQADKERLDAIEAQLAGIGQNKDAIDAIKAQLALLNNTTIPGLQEALNAATTDISSLKTLVAAAQTKADEALTAAAKAYADAEALVKEEVAKVNARLTGQDDKIAEIETKFGDIKAQFASIEDKFASVTGSVAAMEDKIKLINGAFDNINADLADLATKISAADTRLSDYIDAQKEVVKGLEAEIAAVDARVSSLYNSLTAAMNKLVTGVIIQGTDNPVIGSTNLPLGIQSNVLAAYYGEASDDIVFPTNYAANYVFADEARAFEVPADAQTIDIEAGSVLCGSEGNAGKIWVTVNPNTANFDGTAVSIVDTQDEPAPGFAPFVLHKYNGDKLQFGITRSAETNGLYVADATVDAPQLAKIAIDRQQLVDVAKDVLNRNTPLDITKLASTVYSAINNKLPRYAVKVEDGTDGRAIYSTYSLAATAVKPLSFAFLKDGTSSKYRLPMIPSLESFLKNRGFDFTDMKFTFERAGDLAPIPVTVEFEVPDIDKLNITVIDNGTTGSGHIEGDNLADAVVVIDGIDLNVKVEVDSQNKIVSKTIIVDVTEINNFVNKLYDQVDGVVGHANDIIDQIQSLIQSVDNSRYISRINNFISRINNLLANPNSKLQICLLYQTKDGSYSQVNAVGGQLASTFHLNGMTEGSIALVPTSYTAEILAPAFKKYVAVTAAPTAAALAKANSGANINKVIDGRICGVELPVSAKGVYEIAYSALDYCGKITTRKFYINVTD